MRGVPALAGRSSWSESIPPRRRRTVAPGRPRAIHRESSRSANKRMHQGCNVFQTVTLLLRLAERRGWDSNPHSWGKGNDRPIGPSPGKLPAIELLCRLSDPASWDPGTETPPGKGKFGEQVDASGWASLEVITLMPR